MAIQEETIEFILFLFDLMTKGRSH